VGCYHGYLSGVRCRLACGPADATATHCLFSKIQIGCTLLVPAHPVSPGQRVVKRVCVRLFLCRFNSHFPWQTWSASSPFGPSPLPVLDENVWESVDLVNFVCQLLFLSPSRLWTMPMSPHGHCVTTESSAVVHTHTRLTALFRDYPGEPVPER